VYGPKLYLAHTIGKNKNKNTVRIDPLMDFKFLWGFWKMQAIEDNYESLLKRLVNLDVSDASFENSDIAKLQSMRMEFTSFVKDEHSIRFALQHEFRFSSEYYAQEDDKKTNSTTLVNGCSGTVFVKAGYAQMEQWVCYVVKGLSQVEELHCVVMLLPSRTNTAWFHDLICRWQKKLGLWKEDYRSQAQEHTLLFPSC